VTGGREGDRRPDTRRPSADYPRDPQIPDDVTADQLDKGVSFELRTLPEGLAEIVARHLVAADNALVEGDITLARAHIAAAKRRAGRIAPVREAAGIAAYMDGDFTEAIAELRTVRRMTGADEYVPMLADCERGLGRPQRALDLIKEVDQRAVDPATRVELTLVAAGARADLGQVDAALVVLQIPELTKLPKGGPRARLQYAYAELLERAGRLDEAREWMRKAAKSDIEGVTDAEERVEEEAGLAFSEEEFGPESDD
jgi:tetratricopeptide (TPR) repeat protein